MPQKITWMGIEFFAVKEGSLWNVKIMIDSKEYTIPTKCKRVSEVDSIINAMQKAFYEHHAHIMRKREQSKKELKLV